MGLLWLKGMADAITPSISIFNYRKTCFPHSNLGNYLFFSFHLPCQHGLFRGNSQVDVPNWNWAIIKYAGKFKKQAHDEGPATHCRGCLSCQWQVDNESFKPYLIFELKIYPNEYGKWTGLQVEMDRGDPVKTGKMIQALHNKDLNWRATKDLRW